MLLTGALALMLAGCGEERTVDPVETRAPVVLDSAVVAVEPQILPDATEETAAQNAANGQARERAETFGYLYGIKTDGSVVLREVTERNEAGEYVPVENPDWTDIVAIDTWGASFVGIRSDGTLLMTGYGDEVLWTDIRCPGE